MRTLVRLARSRRVRRIGVVLLLAGCAGLATAAAAFLIVAGRAQRDFRPVLEALSPERSALIARIPKYRRAEESTYLTFSEWYLVFNPQEYAEFLRSYPPSQFPYWKSLRQIWGGYAQVYAIARRHYPFNGGDHLSIVVIATSATIEWVIKGAYENTIGRLSEWIGGGSSTAEDRYAAEVAREYGDFVPTRPFFEFPFGHRLIGLWSKTDFFGPHFIRKCERKFFLSLEYGVKWIYSAAIRAGSHAVYGVADTEVFASATNISDAAFATPGVRKVQPLGDGAWIITVPHYQGFTDTVPLLAQQGVHFEEIAGNDEIMLTLIAPTAWRYDLSAGRPLFTMELLSGTGFERVAVQAPIKSLDQMLREIATKGLRLEHLFDY